LRELVVPLAIGLRPRLIEEDDALPRLLRLGMPRRERAEERYDEVGEKPDATRVMAHQSLLRQDAGLRPTAEQFAAFARRRELAFGLVTAEFAT
jgi:hypothetical protein